METELNADLLTSLTEDQLYSALGAAQKRTRVDVLQQLRFDVSADTVSIQSDAQVGHSMFQTFNKQAYDFFCGGCGGEGKDCLDHMKAALGISTKATEVIKAVGDLLAVSFGWAGWIAAIVAAILVRFVIPSAYNDLCVVWGERV
jgi:hypothetical protein